MPLSEHEQRILAEMEESLVRQDPQFAERVKSKTVYRHAGRHCIWGALGFAAGVAILVTFYSESVLVGLLGVLVMFVSAVVFERNLRRMGRAGWHDLTKNLHEERRSGESGERQGDVNGAFRSTREWLRSHFRREG